MSNHPVVDTPGHPRASAVPDRVHGRSSAAKTVTHLFATAGITVNGVHPWDIQVFDERFFSRGLTGGSLAMGESYMDGWWDAPALDEFFTRVHKIELYNRVGTLYDFWLRAISRVLNRQSRRRSVAVAERHYNLGTELYERMLGPDMQYTCAYWQHADRLDTAQENKLSLIARKLCVEPGMTVLDLGCGFGGLARYLAERHGCRVVSYNISAEQVEYARALCAGLPVRVELKDYREARFEPAQFDRVAAIGLCEHIGPKNYRRFLELARHTLRNGGLFLLHTIGANRTYRWTDPWIDKYIFPGGVIPSIAELGRAMEGLWVVEDWHNFGPDYDRTLLAWWDNFDLAWPELATHYGERFRRMWKYYLAGCAGAFRARKLQLWQIVLSKGDIRSYTSVR
jgi:cyclopropane-fatty-acyl-phospholipid synthase